MVEKLKKPNRDLIVHKNKLQNLLFSVISCNVRGMTERSKRIQIYQYLRMNKCEVNFLQETHCTKNRQKQWRNEWSSTAYFSNGESNARGVAILLSKNFDFTVEKMYQSEEGRYLCLVGKYNDMKIALVNVYAPNEDAPEFFEQLFELVNSLEVDHFICGGDFNKCLNNELDKKGKETKPTKSAEFINAYMNENDWVDIWRIGHPSEKQFTWFRRQPVTMSRIDLFISSMNTLQNVNSCDILPGRLSDHSFVKLDVSFGAKVKGRGFWKFNNALLLDKTFVEMMNVEIEAMSNEYAEGDPALRWELVKLRAQDFSSNYSRGRASEQKKEIKNLDHKINQLRKKLAIINLKAENAVQIIHNTNLKIDILEEKLNKFTLERARGAMLRSKTNWVQNGEKNSSYFLRLEKSKARNKAMTVVKREDGSISKNFKEIMNEQEKFYKNLYKKDENVKFTYTNAEGIKVNDSQRHLLSAELKVEELSEAIKGMPNSKSPGADGLTADFYKVFWRLLKPILFEAINYAIKTGRLHSSARRGVLTLLPKKGRDILYLKSWRPISLLTVDFKIYSKALANRIKQVLPSIISEDQSGFVAGRNITTNIMKALTIQEYCKEENIPGLLISVDFLKAFDRVDYNAMYKAMEFFGIEGEYLKLIKILFQDFELCTLNNGLISNWFTPNKGIIPRESGCTIPLCISY